MFRNIIFLLFATLFIPVNAEVKLPRLFSDNMVIQRNKPIKIWGWADKNELITVEFNGKESKARTGNDGKWTIVLPAQPYGGPYTLSVKGKESTISLKNILLGDVWLCSGQSNMEMKLSGAKNSAEEIAAADYPMIRIFNVPRAFSYNKEEDLTDGSWLVCNSQTASSFSAVAYFFARKTFQETGIPIGILNSSWGGTLIESWTGLESFNNLPSDFIRKYGDTPKLIEPSSKYAVNESKKEAYLKAIDEDAGMNEKWFLPSTQTTTWKTASVPQSWNLNELKNIDGVVWFRYDFDISEKTEDTIATVSLGTIGDEDEVWLNGIKIGTEKNKFAKRNYSFKSDILNKGKNSIIVRIIDNGQNGGLNGSSKDLFVQVGKNKISLVGNWHYRVSVDNNNYNYKNIWRNSYPSLTYNSMLYPLLNYAIKGVIWYQGEQNTGNASQYKTLLPNMIEEWRSDWGYTFPFYIIQLPNFKQPNSEPPFTSEWATIREAQMSALHLPETSVIGTIDLGEADDIHPRNKQDVGIRTALAVLNKTYGRTEIVSDGPIYKSFEKSGNRIIISFSDTASKLVSSHKYGYIKGFSIAGANRKFVWAQAFIDDNKVIVFSDKVDNPEAVRYDWADNPDGTLYNSSGLPTFPFRTDNW